ncbi:hypothetical protein GPECTOR_16g633 [Gonium pectorale]|uniref:Integrase catalytic domain-containing protein n=1 Tax=Gonium pectorale TaxID=33097 RepID=A0A150GKT1_GONPE|nr:hypothetical protein GPECTOR_16g633 [Gonium pectorale]|eukprot:KXZ50459.1 hypothetical protein GPECTOR_16g633 [Gonium pectorale]
MERLVRKNLVQGLDLPLASVQAAAKSVCGTCVTAKGTSVQFASSSVQPQQPLELTHSDVCGPFPVTGRGGSRYAITLLDDATGLAAVRTIPSKDNAGEAVRDMIVQLEARARGAKVQQFRSDNGGEYIASQLERWLADRGIAHQYSAPYTPQQNGAAERLNRTLQDRVRALLSEAELPPSFWPDALVHAVAIRNLSPLYDGDTPWQRFFGSPPDVSGLRTFGCCAYVLANDPDKLSPRKELGTFLGYERGSAAFRVLIGSQIVISSNVTFDDSVRGPASRRPGSRFGDNGDNGSSAAAALADAAAAPADATEAPKSATPYEEAMASPFAAEWHQAMNEEMASQIANGTWELSQLPPGQRALACRWVYTVKRQPDGSIERFKARLVAKGFQQRPGLDFGELFAPTTRYASLRALLSVAAAQRLIIHQLDVKTAFLNGELEEELWMQQPPGYSNGDPQLACRLRKSIYGLKQAPRCWYEKLSSDLGSIGFVPSSADAALFVQSSPAGTVYALCHVDDLLVAAACEQQLAASKTAIGDCFTIRDLGPANVYLGMEIRQDASNGDITLSQQRYTAELLERYRLSDAKARSTPLPAGARLLPADDGEPLLADGGSEYRAIIGSLNYLATSTRPDIAQAISALARYMAAPTQSHLRLAYGVLRYLAGTRSFGLRFSANSPANAFTGYSDSDWAGDPTTRRSTTGYVFGLGSAAVSWSSQLQRTVAASSVEAEYQAAAAAVREALWLRKLAVDLRLPAEAISIKMDSQGALSLAHSPITSVRSKHIDVHHHLVRERVVRGEVQLSYCPTEHMVADILTKPLGEIKFRRCREAMGLTSI